MPVRLWERAPVRRAHAVASARSNVTRSLARRRWQQARWMRSRDVELGVEVRQGARLRDVFGLHGPDIDHGPVREKERLIAQIQTSPPQEDMEGLLEDLHGSDQVELSAQCRHRRLAERMWAPRDKHEDVGVHAAPDAGLEGGAGPSLAWRSIIGAGFALTRDAGLKTGAPFPAAPSTRRAVHPFSPAAGQGDGVTSTPPVTPASWRARLRSATAVPRRDASPSRWGAASASRSRKRSNEPPVGRP